MNVVEVVWVDEEEQVKLVVKTKGNVKPLRTSQFDWSKM